MRTDYTDIDGFDTAKSQKRVGKQWKDLATEDTGSLGLTKPIAEISASINRFLDPTTGHEYGAEADIFQFLTGKIYENRNKLALVVFSASAALPLAGGTMTGAINFDSQNMTNVDIDSGTIDGVTIARSNITVGANTTLDVRSGTFATSAAQRKTIIEGAASNIDIGAYELRAQTLESDVATGTAPLTVASTTTVANLEAATVATIAGLAPNTATTQATQAAITTCANLATVGTIGTGVWQGTAIAHAYIGADAIEGDNIADNAVSNEHLADNAVDTAEIAASAVETAKINDDAVTFAKASGVTPNVYGSVIKLIPSDFASNDDGGNTKFGVGYVEGAGAGYGMRPSNSAVELFAFVSIPEGMKATHVHIYAKGTYSTEVFEAQIDATTMSSKGTGNCNTNLAITEVNATAANFLAISVNTTATTDKVYGGIVTIATI